MSENNTNPEIKNGNEKGVSLGPERETEIAGLLKKLFRHWMLPNESFTVITEICHEFAYASATLQGAKTGETFQAEVCIHCDENDISNPIDAHHASLDALQLVFDDYFTSDRVTHYLGIWQEYENDNQKIKIKTSRANQNLEDQADAFLRAHGFDIAGDALNNTDQDPIDDD